MADNDTSSALSAAPRTNSGVDKDHAALEQARVEKEFADRDKKTRKAQNKAIAKANEPNDPLRSLKLAGAFVKGTVMGALGGVGNGARYGLLLGGVAGIIGMVGLTIGGGGAILFWAIPLGVIGGMALGGMIGLLSGGVKEMNREARREKQQDDEVKSKGRAARPSIDLEDVRDAHRERTHLNFDRSRQQDLENQRDSQTAWQDRIAAESSGWGMGR